MKINFVNAISYKTNNITQSRITNFEKTLNGNVEFDFSKEYSNSIKSSALSSISFSGNIITKKELSAKQDEVNQLASDTWEEHREIVRKADSHYKHGIWQHGEVIEQLEKAKDFGYANSYYSSGVLNLECETENIDGKTVPTKVRRYFPAGELAYVALLQDGKPYQITSPDFDNEGSECIYQYYGNTSHPRVFIKGRTSNGFKERFVYSPCSNFTMKDNAPLSLYEAGREKNSKNIINIKKSMEFIPNRSKAELSKHQVDIQKFKDGNLISRGKSFEFTSAAETYEYIEKYAVKPDGSIEQGEKLLVEDFGIIEYDKGFSQLSDGTVVRKPKISLKNGKVIEISGGYTKSSSGELKVEQNLFSKNGIPSKILTFLGFYK